MQAFKENDQTELKIKESAAEAFDLVSAAQDSFYTNGENCSAFILSLYDSGRLPFSNRIGRDFFLPFFRKLLENADYLGSFESILFILREIFGSESEIVLAVPAAGKLTIDISSYDDLLFLLAGEEIDGSEFTFITHEGDELIISEVLGIETEAELTNLFAEIITAGVFFTPSINFFTRYFFVAEEGSDLYDVIDHTGDQIIFLEVGG